MASREKRPLAPSKSKQRANNNDSSLSSLSSRTKKGKTLPTYILEAVATGSNKLSSKLESSLPRKKVIASLKCKKKLRATKGNLIKVKSTKTVPVKNLKRLASQAAGKNSKNILNRTKKNKLVSKDIDKDVDCVPLNDKNIETTLITPKSSPKSGKKLKITVLTETPLKSNTKITKLSPSSGKKITNKNSIDLTIDEVVGMLSDTEMEEHAMDMDKLEGKLTRSKKMLLEEHEIKKEMIEIEDEKSDDDNSVETSPEGQSSSHSRKRSSQRSLRNGKLRQLDLTGDLDNKKNRRLNLDDTTPIELSSEMNNETISSCALTTSVLEQSSTTTSTTKEEVVEKVEESSNINLELENNNNSEHIDRVGASGDAGPILRSKTKAKSTDIQLKSEDCESDETKMTAVKSIEEPKKLLNMDQLRKDCLLGKLSNDKQPPAKRRSSLNIDVKKTMGSLYGTEKTDGTTPKSHIDQMIETIKLTIAKSIESKIFGPEKALGLSKSFEVPKIEEIVAPLSTETQKMGLDEQGRTDDKPNVSKVETVTSNSSGENSNSVPKVADTAKEIEKLVMGDIDTVIDTIPNTESAGTSSSSSSNQEIILAQSSTSSTAADVCQLNTPEATQSSASCHINEIEDSNTEDKFDSKEISEDNVVIETEEPETLETISREVERLVSESAATSVTEPLVEKVNDNEVKEDEDKIIEATECPIKHSEVKNSPKEPGNADDISDVESKVKLPENLQKDSDDASTSGDSTSSVSIQSSEVSEDKVRNETILRLLGLNSSEKNAQDKTIVDDDQMNKSKEDKRTTEESKIVADESRRVLRTRDKQKKTEKISKTEGDNSRSDNNSEESVESKIKLEDSSEESIWIKVEESEPQTRTRRSRDVKKRKEESSPPQSALKSKRHRRESKKNDQQNKEETLLDNEVAKINENTRSFSAEKFSKRLEGTESLRVLSESGRGRIEKSDNRSKSENDIDSAKEGGKPSRLAHKRCESDEPKETENPEGTSDVECKVKIVENLQKDSDEASTSGDSTSSVSLQISETPEDKARKETILRLLGLESLEKAAERLHHQKVKREQYTGTLKTVIRIQKDKERDKKRSRSPLKMVLKQGRTDGEGDSPEFYTIQKELGTSGLGDSSSGANRKFSTNHRQSCDEDNEETLSKCPLIIPEKSSSFSIHPGRLCADVCCYCFGKFGSLDTPMHLAQMKSDERRKKILSVERHLTKDSCLCDACYRHVDRKANASPTNMGPKPQRVHRQLLVSKCYVRDCRGPARHLVKRRWLHKIKSCVQSRMNIDINWEPSQHTSMSFCVDHYAMIERFLTCSLCTRRLARNATHQLGTTETEELNRLLEQQGIPIPLEAGTFVCKLCRYFTQIQLKYKDVENMNANHRSFSKSYRKRILHYNDIEALENEEDEESPQSILNKDKRKKSKSLQGKSGPSKSPDEQSTSEKSTPEPVKIELTTSGTEIERHDDEKSNNDSTIDDCPSTDVHMMDLESTVEKLKKRKALDQHLYSTDSPIFSDNGGDVVEILAMDKEVTLTRLPKRPRVSNNNDITPVVQRLGANPSISVRTLFPGEEEMGLNANIEFSNVRDVTPQGWEKCATIIQYDRDTKILWQELQRPYGNQSSFLRHLILLEKYYRSGDLVLAPNASRNAINYSTSVQNRLISYEGPEKMDEPITDTMSTEYNNSRRLSGGYVMERDRLSIPSTSTLTTTVTATPIKSTGHHQLNAKINPTRILKINSGVSIIKKKPPPNLQLLSLPSSSGSASATNGSAKRKDGFPNKITGGTSGGKVFQLSEPDFKRLQSLKKQKMLNEKMPTSTPTSATITNAKSNVQYQRAQMAAQTQFQKHLLMQQEMLSRQSRGDFEPLICDVRSLVNENSPAQNLLNNLNLPKSIQVTTKPSNNPIPILPKIPKSLTVIPQTVPRPIDK